MKKLFLDDVREPWDDSWTLVRSAKEFRDYIESNGIPDVVSYDHDLSPEHYAKVMYSTDPGEYNKLYNSFTHQTGLDCAKWLCEVCVEKGLKIPVTNVHSMNPIGASNISSTVMNYALFYFEEELNVPTRPYHLGPPPGL